MVELSVIGKVLLLDNGDEAIATSPSSSFGLGCDHCPHLTGIIAGGNE